MIERLRQFVWHYFRAELDRAAAKDRKVEQLRKKAIDTRIAAETTRIDIMRGSFGRSDGRLARR